MNFTLREVDKKFMSERAYRTPLHAHILCGGLVTALALLEALFFSVSSQSLSIPCGEEHFAHERPQQPICCAPEDVSMPAVR